MDARAHALHANVSRQRCSSGRSPWLAEVLSSNLNPPLVVSLLLEPPVQVALNGCALPTEEGATAAKVAAQGSNRAKVKAGEPWKRTGQVPTHLKE